MLKCSIIGNIGSDPDMRYTAAGKPRLQFNVASNTRTRNASGEYEESVEWVRVTILGQRAEALAQHLVRGVRVYVDGRLESRPWIDRSNAPRAGLELLADSVEFVSSKRAPDLDLSELDNGPIRASVADERRTPVSAGARSGAQYATGSDDVDLEDLGDPPF